MYIAYVINREMYYSLLWSQSEASPIDGYGYVEVDGPVLYSFGSSRSLDLKFKLSSE